MTGTSRWIAAAAAGGLVLLCVAATEVRAQSSPQPVARLVSVAYGLIAGVVLDEKGAPIPGATVSALGAVAALAVTNGGGRFELGTLAPGSYLVRAHVSGFVGSRGQIVEVRASARSASSIALRRAVPAATTPAPASPPILAASMGGTAVLDAPAAPDPAPATAAAPPSTDDDHTEVAWRLRHMRRGILKEVVLSDAVAASGAPPNVNLFGARAAADTQSSSLAAASLFAGIPFSGQFNLLTTGSFDSPQQLFTTDSFSRNIAYVSLAAPVGDHGDWSMRGALTQGDISSWFVAGAYATRGPARHRYDLGLSYSTQRYDGGNPAALREVTDGSRNVGALYGFDTFSITPALAVAFGARFSRYDYLTSAGLLSPRLELTVSPGGHFRISALASSRALAPGAEEFLPPMATGLWLPPQRTFSSLAEGKPLASERTNEIALESERDFGESTVSLRVFRQHVDDQLMTLFGVDVPTAPGAHLGHYLVGNVGDVDASGWSAAVRTAVTSRLRGAIAYSLTTAAWNHPDAAGYMVLVGPSFIRPSADRIHDLSTSIETNVPETATRLLVVYRLTNTRQGPGERPSNDARFDVQVRQSLPFMDFSSAKWEMLLAVKNTFREAADQSSVYDELLVIRPPKRIVGGLTLRF